MMELYNFNTVSVNESYQVIGNLVFSYDGYRKSIECGDPRIHDGINSQNGSHCETDIPNGSGVFELPVFFQGEKGEAIILMGAVFYNGKMFRSKSGLFFDEDINNCLILEDAENSQFYLQPNENSVTCSSMNSNCSQIIIPENDFGFDFSLLVTDAESFRLRTTAGELMKRNGVFMMDDNEFFTKEKPCWKSTFKTTNDTVSTSSFCCKKFSPSSTMDKCLQYESRTSFRDIYENSEIGFLQAKYTNLMLSSIDWIVLTIDILLFTVSLPLFGIYIYASMKSKQYHPNLRILEINWTIFLFLIQLGPFVWTTQALIYGNLNPKMETEVYTRFIVFYGMCGMRVVFHSLIVERTFATFLSHFYEKRKLSIISIPLVFSAHVGGCAAAIFWGLKSFPIQYFWLVTVLVDFTAVILISKLSKYNSELHSVSLVRLQLSERFQIIENIKSLKAVSGVVAVGAIFNLTISLLEFTCYQIGVDEKFMKILFYIAPVGFATIEVITARIFNENFRKSTRKIFSKFKASFLGKTVDSIFQVPGDIKNVFGKNIVVEETMNKRFEQLQKQWG
ncbi:hypothetical protein FO519_002566 [Halicephalobus sp. NKZ332]|nr:hypothetical protein FO519_002566 [Halicephalobus sp. NKZ332]